MLKKESLRIGSYVVFGEEDKIFQITGFNGNGLEVKSSDGEETWIEFDRFTGVDLCEKTLTKLGYADKSFSIKKGFGPTLWLPVPNLKSELHFELGGENWKQEVVTSIKSDYCDLILDKIEYIHELQNLVYCLTGLELTFDDSQNIKY